MVAISIPGTINAIFMLTGSLTAPVGAHDPSLFSAVTKIAFEHEVVLQTDLLALLQQLSISKFIFFLLCSTVRGQHKRDADQSNLA